MDEIILLILVIVYFVFVGLLLIPIIGVYIMYRKIKSCDDVFLVMKQFKYISSIALVAVIFWLSMEIIEVVSHRYTTELFVIFDGLKGVVCFQILSFFIVMIDTCWVIKYVIINDEMNTLFQSIRVSQVLSNSNAIDVFMDHLSNGMLFILYIYRYININIGYI